MNRSPQTDLRDFLDEVADGGELKHVAGAHWDDQAFPADRFPDGPPDGEAWDIRTNTNFSRSVDAEMLESLRGPER